MVNKTGWTAAHTLHQSDYSSPVNVLSREDKHNQPTTQTHTPNAYIKPIT